MAKLSAGDVLTILGDFDQATTTLQPRDIKRLSVDKPTEYTTLTSFMVNQRQLFIVSDVTAADEPAYVKRVVTGKLPNASLKLYTNPAVPNSYGLPYKGKDVYLLEVEKPGMRLDSYLAETSPEFSRSTWQKYIKSGFVTVDKIVTTTPKTIITPDAVVTTAIPKAPNHSDQPLAILYEDDDVIVINKPVGMLTHSKGALHDEYSVADFFRTRTTFARDSNRPGIVHRLDRDTSGVLIGAKNPEAAQFLQRQFSQRRVKKTYTALLDGRPKQPEARLELPIGRHPANPSTFRVDGNGKSAVTTYHVITETGVHSLVELQPTTGRTHQLRVHMAYLGTPIHGDRVYGKPADRLYLHARDLEITLPSKERKVFHAAVPPEFEQYLQGQLS